MHTKEYSAVHKWMSYHYGKASNCEHDYTHTGRVYDWANISGKYLRERKDWKQLCRSCHSLMDRGDYCKYGHKYTVENTHIKQKKGENPYRQCRQCNKLWARSIRGGFNPKHHLAKV